MSNEKREKEMMAAADRYADEVCDGINDGARVIAINDFCAGWRAADSHPAWVSVEERLPEERKVVWVRKHFKRKSVGEFDLYDSAAFCNGEFQCDASGHVTHWMEIVPPVKKGGQDDSNVHKN